MSLYKKIFFTFSFIASQLLPAGIVFAGLTDINLGGIANEFKPNQVSEELLKKYHIDPSALRNVGETLNVSENKMTAPEVSVFFTPANPVPGQEITAQASPVYFSNSDNRLYFTWYLKHKDCDEDGSVRDSDDNKFCDTDDDGDIDEEDWKIEAMRILANGGFDTTGVDYSTSNHTDNDGYEASLGGDGSKNIPNRCYIQDFDSGRLYEMAGGTYSVTYGCSPGTTPRCVPDAPQTIPCSDNPNDLSDTTDYPICETTSVNLSCSDTVVTGCPANTSARCIPDSFVTPTRCNDPSDPSDLRDPNIGTSCSSLPGSTAITSCSIDSSRITNACEHLFPKSGTDRTAGPDGDFGASEEHFWRTDPNDPDTAGTGYGDEANVAGLGQKAFTWNYEVGDKVGVVVEGTSIIPTKHDDRSYAVMWALPKNDCPVTPATGDDAFYKETVRGYDVTFYRTVTNINNCLKNNLIDPREGGQMGKLDLALSSSPQTLFNDASGDNFGTTLSVFGSVTNTESPENLLHYEWKVYASTDGSFNPRGYSNDPDRDSTGAWSDITTELTTKKLISFTQGNGVNHLEIKLNLAGTRYFPDDSGHFKVTAKVTEYNELHQKSRGDTASIILPITSTDRRLTAKGVTVSNTNTLGLGATICDERVNTDPTNVTIPYNPVGIGRNICLVAKNEIIGLTISANDNNIENLGDFQWTVNGNPLTCTGAISALCNNTEPTTSNFLPITGNPGEQYEVVLTAIDATSGKKVTLSKAFQIIEPMVRIEREEESKNIVWPKYLGYYKSTDGNAYEHLSDTQFQGYSGNNPKFSLKFLPSWLKDRSTWQWSLNGTPFGENAQQNPAIIPLTGSVGQMYTLSAEAVSLENANARSIRKALNDFWGHSVFESADSRMSHSIQVQIVVNEEEEFSLSSPKSVFAAIAKNASNQIMFIFQLFLSVLTLIVFMGMIFSLSGKR